MEKIIVFHHCGDLGGAGISLINTVLMLQEVFDVVVYTERGKILELMQQRDIVVKQYKKEMGAISSYSGSPSIISRTYMLKLLKIFGSIQELNRIIKQERPDVILVNSITTSYMCFIAAQNAIPSVAFVRETRRNDWGTIINENILSKYADAVLFISEYDKETYRIEQDNSHVIYNSVRIDDYNFNLAKEEACSRFRLQPDKFYVLYLGGSSLIKGWEIVKKVIKKNLPHIHFIIAGECAEDEQVLQENVSYIGLQDDISFCMTCADVLIFPVESPHQGRPIFEAGAFYLPVIIPKFDVFSESVIDGYNGWYYKPQNIDELVEKIICLKQDKELCRQMGYNNHTMTFKNHIFDVNKKRMQEVFKRIVQRGIYEEVSNYFS